MVAGFALWFYTLLLPSLIKSGLIVSEILINGPFGIGLLKPENLFGITGMDPLSHSVFWSLLLNIGFYVIASLMFERNSNDSFCMTLETPLASTLFILKC